MTENSFVFPVSFAQERLWFMDRILPGTPLFNLNTALRLKMPVNIGVLERSLNEIIRRHEALRTTFAVVDERPVQVIAQAMTLALPIVDLRHLPPSEREAETLRLVREEARRPFDLARGPLIRSTLLYLDEQDYIFLLTMHHIVSDGWSMGIFWKELGALWSAFAAGAPSPLPELPIQYADFAVWQRDWLQGKVLDYQLAYWKQQLRDLPVLQLPTDHPRPAVQTFNGAMHNITLPAPLTAALKALSQRKGVTLFMTLLAAFQALLHRYTAENDIVVGTYIAGRNRAEIEALIGFFLNSLVLRISLTGDDTFSELLERVRKMTLDAYAHQDVPFAKLVEELQPERDLSRNPLFQVMFQLLNVPTLSQIAADPQPDVLEVQRGTAVFDLSCMLQEVGEELSGYLEYNADLFDTSTIVRMAAHYQTMLEGIVADPEQHLSELPLLTRAERYQLLVEWNGTNRRYPEDQSIVDLFEAQAAQRANTTAFIYEGMELSYNELNRRANQLAHHLVSLGVGREVLVGVCLERSLDLVVALMAVFKAGAAYLPLDPTYPRERLGFMLEDARVPVLLTEQQFAAMFPAYQGRIVCIDVDRQIIARQSEANPNNPVTAEHLAYVIYTSGSTGLPKGVAVEHRQLLNRFAWMWEVYPFQAQEMCCQKTALSFVDSIWELFGPLLQGVPTIIIPDRVLRDPEALVETLANHRVTRIWVVPSLLRILMDAHPDLQDRLPALTFWVTSGEALATELLEQFQTIMPLSVLYNLYGTSEVWDATWYDTRTCSGRLWRVPIGRPISNVHAYVLDPRLRPAPIGVPGELYIGGIGLAREYLHRPELTAEKFIPNPFSEQPGERLYRTGDFVRYLPDGNIEYIERIDHQVKLRGFRVELHEIEVVLSQHGGVHQVVVVADANLPGDNRLVAYVVPRQHMAPTVAELRTFLNERLPHYMVPAGFMMLESLPLTPSGKVNRRALPKPQSFDPSTAVAYVAPQTDVERTIVRIWKEVLRIDKVGTHDNFFDLGGHSLLMFQVYSRLQRDLSKQFSMTDLFRYPTISSLAKYFNQEPDDSTSFLHIQDRIDKRKEALIRRRQALIERSK